MTYADIKALSDGELFAAHEREERKIGGRRDVSRALYIRLGNEIRYRTSTDDGTEAAERKFGC